MMAAPSLETWNNYYIVVGSAAAGLTGLTFVVIALAADTRRANPGGLSAYVAPTIIHFACVLALAAYLCVPGHTLLSLSIGFGALGVFGVLFGAFVARGILRIAEFYAPVLEDWVWHVSGPELAYAALCLMALLVWHHLAFALYGVALIAAVLLFVGIHNAWDVAVSISAQRQKETTAGESQER
jgi:hypothetical protein